MLIDCDDCAMRDLRCDECVVTVVLRSPASHASRLEVDDAERQALSVLADSGLVPRLRMVPVRTPRAS